MMKYCSDCIYYSPMLGACHAAPVHLGRPSLVKPNTYIYNGDRSCEYLRSSPTACGEGARWFEKTRKVVISNTPPMWEKVMRFIFPL